MWALYLSSYTDLNSYSRKPYVHRLLFKRDKCPHLRKFALCVRSQGGVSAALLHVCVERSHARAAVVQDGGQEDNARGPARVSLQKAHIPLTWSPTPAFQICLASAIDAEYLMDPEFSSTLASWKHCTSTNSDTSSFILSICVLTFPSMLSPSHGYHVIPSTLMFGGQCMHFCLFCLQHNGPMPHV